ncbi:MAG: sialidase family protein [Rhodothermales bacterium]
MKRLILLLALAGCQPDAEPTPRAEILGHIRIYEDADAYAAWPALVETRGGDLLLAFTSTEQHVSPDGAIVAMRSADRGRTWTGPDTLYDSIIDDRESGLTALPDGRILAHIWSTHWTRTDYETTYGNAYDAERRQRWINQVDRPAYRDAAPLHGSWLLVSEDEGRTWSAPRRGPDTIHGGVALQDGSLLVAAYRTNEGHIGVYAAPDPASEWEQIATVTCPTPDILRFGEPHIVQLDSGRILMAIRGTAIPYNDQSDLLNVWLTYSDDGGRTWADPFQAPLWGFPPHLFQLSDGRVLLTYGYRRPPYGERAAISPDGITWSADDEIILRDDAPNHDLGYPASLEIAPDTLLTVYYQRPDTTSHKVDIWGTIWTVR